MKKIPSKCYCGIMFDGKKKMMRHRSKCPIARKIAVANVGKQALKNLEKAKQFRIDHPDIFKERYEKSLSNYQFTKEEKERRSKLMRSTNDKFREKFNKIRSQNAIRTANRPDIIEFRSEVLAKWRKENPEKYQQILRDGRKSLRNSRAEEWIFKNVLSSLQYKRGSQIRCGSKLKQVDFVKGNIWIEVDGCWHFGIEFSKGRFDANKVHARDMMLCKEAELRGDVSLVRLGLDCWRGNGKRKLGEEWQTALEKLLKNPKPGIWLFGKSYQQGVWEKDICLTWKYVTQPTILPSLME